MRIVIQLNGSAHVNKQSDIQWRRNFYKLHAHTLTGGFAVAVVQQVRRNRNTAMQGTSGVWPILASQLLVDL